MIIDPMALFEALGFHAYGHQLVVFPIGFDGILGEGCQTDSKQACQKS